MKKILNLVILFILVLLVTSVATTKVYAATITGTPTLTTPKDTYSKGDEIVVTFSISNFKAEGSKVISLGAVLDYDKTNLNFEKISKQGEWADPSGYYNQANGQFVTDKTGTYNNNEVILTITFTAKTEKADNVNITIKNIEIADGTGVGAQKLADVTKTIKIGDSTTPDNPDNPTTPDNPNDPSNPDNPNNPDNPSNPSKPNNPSNPNNPNDPSNQNNPTDSDNPNNPNDPTDLDKPGTQQTPSQNNNGQNTGSKDKTSNKDLPNTGKSSNIFLLILIAVFAIIIIVSIMKNRKKKIKIN